MNFRFTEFYEVRSTFVTDSAKLACKAFSKVRLPMVKATVQTYKQKTK